QGGAASASANLAAPSGAQTTEATLSGAQSVDSVLASTPAVDSERVAEIKRAIAEGRFQVNPERIADGLLQSVRDMLASGR
ncbi:MAG TPA: flagellar biosynthesis anti-sigma factor FlgM, partial [Rhodocyclaceae bacterium]|nr:flagellar biosynthesis anti-sigma factor FlgM [Rhodocyclaceae bacterium]